MSNTKKDVTPIPTVVETRDLREIKDKTGNTYLAITVVGKRANQIAAKEKDELISKLAEFATTTDNLEEIFENREQIEISRFYERKPKATLVAMHEFLNDDIFYREPEPEQEEQEETEE
ncbi:MAG: DNA-directed RNA polymerase subunit omega [Bacteroidetes bacterium]|nr:DNA-directed RNA polymerase subunit omega [Bacteroidota bacterium]